MEKTYECLKETIEEQIKLISKKGDKITADEMASLHYALESMDKIDELMEKEKMKKEGTQYSEGYHYGYNRGRMDYGYNDNMDNGMGRNTNSYMTNNNNMRSPVSGRYIGTMRSNMNYGNNGMNYGNNYQGHSVKDRIIAAIEPMYDNAQSEHERQIISNTINWIQNEA